MSSRRLASALLAAVCMPLALPASAFQSKEAVQESQPSTTLALSGVRVSGVGHHPEDGITPASIQAVADAAWRAATGGAPGAVQVGFAQLEAIAASITNTYRQAGFPAAQAFLPQQAVGDDGIVRIEVVEGRVGAVRVEGSRRYRDDQLNARALQLVGQPLRMHALERAVLHARDLPGVSVDATLEPGTEPGTTDIVLHATDSQRPYQLHAALSNHGTPNTGRYRVEAGIDAYNLLRAGDTLTATLGHGIDPADSWLASIALDLPLRRQDGLSLAAGASRSQMEINSGMLAPLGIHGPTTLAQLGVDWTFADSSTLLARATLRWMHERSTLEALGMEMSRHAFDVVEAGLRLRRVDRRWRGIDQARFTLRKAVDDDSATVDLMFPPHDPGFVVGRVDLARLQTLPARQRVLLQAAAQFTDSALVPLEQFALGGPASVRAHALSSALGDRGVQATLEYQVDAPGALGNVLAFTAFYDWGRVSPAQRNRALGIVPTTLQGIGLGLGLRLPGSPGWQLDLAAAKPTGDTRSSDDGLQVWGRIGLAF